MRGVGCLEISGCDWEGGGFYECLGRVRSFIMNPCERSGRRPFPGCLGGVWGVFGGCLGGVWGVFKVIGDGRFKNHFAVFLRRFWLDISSVFRGV